MTWTMSHYAPPPPPPQVIVDRFPTSTLHVVSDGGVDHSQEFFFRRLRGLRPSTVHTTAFHCRDWWVWSTLWSGDYPSLPMYVATDCV